MIKVIEYFANRRVLFLQNLTKHLASVNEEIKRVFGYRLNDSELARMDGLNNAYLKSISYK